MSLNILKRFVIYGALALSPAVLFAQATPYGATSPSNSNQATKSTDTQSDSSKPAAGTQSDSSKPAAGTQLDSSKPAAGTKSDDLMAYQKELAACDKLPVADQATCRTKADEKYAKKSSPNTPAQSSGKSS